MTDPRSLSQWREVVDAFAGASTVALATHVNPDGDAIGSLLAASLALRSLGKETFASWGESPLEVPETYAFLPGVDTLLQPEDVPQVDLFVALDCGAADRLGALEDAVVSAPRSVNIDHHPGNDGFATINIVVEDASSTAEIVTRLLEDLGAPMTREVATCLYTGIVTDTGRFQYANTTPEVLRLAADLLARGVPAPQVAQEVFESAPFGYLKLTGVVLDRARLHEEERFVYSWVTRDDLSSSGVESNETDKLVDLVRATRSADVAAIFKERPDGTWRVSLRSKGPRSVGAIARAHGGGGHELAAGFTASDVRRAVDAILAGLAEQRE
ncbi:MAG TPA: bifunctional oligoribonuclease/PAP phosphatase NrnA [Actinomycetota bacterium]|jgi:bifunctional oligoribonuclease and PAP phosphatase NrnA|nr:bifunctional oligoribonuclease/PAP phosphatase NrnA [Actinomycetota bacterium]